MTPSELIRDSSRTPFNIGTAIALSGFTLEEAEPLATGLEDVFQQPSLVMMLRFGKLSLVPREKN